MVLRFPWAHQELIQEVDIEEEKEEHLLVAQIRARKKKDEPDASIVPIVATEPNRKTIEVPVSKETKEKKEVKVLGQGRTKKGKMLSSAMSVAKIRYISLFDVGLYT